LSNILPLDHANASERNPVLKKLSVVFVSVRKIKNHKAELCWLFLSSIPTLDHAAGVIQKQAVGSRSWQRNPAKSTFKVQWNRVIKKTSCCLP
jgi:hypothetical protein